MDITSETIKSIIELAAGKQIDMSDTKYTTRPIYRCYEPIAKPLKGFSLAAVVDYLKGNPDALASCLIEVNSRYVCITSPLNSDQERSLYFISEPQLPYIPFGDFIDVESFKIILMSNFVQDDNTKALLKFLASICEESKGTLTDDGISQTMSVRKGVATLDIAPVPNPVTLRPYRTFYDIEQPASAFVFRMKEGPRAALFEADGGAWKGKEVESIKKYLQDKLVDASGELLINLLG